MDNNNLLINLEDITFSYPGEAPILKNLYLQLHEGERLGLVGMNGSGKTSLFHVIMGLLKPLRRHRLTRRLMVKLMQALRRPMSLR